MTWSSCGSRRRMARSAVMCSLAAAMMLEGSGCNSTGEPPHEPARPRVVVVAARQMTVPIVVNPIGTTRALEDVTIRARVKGFLKEKHFQDGGLVKPSQLLLVIDEEPFQLQLDQSQALLAAAEAALKKAESSKGREVAKAQLELDQAQMLLDQVEERRARNLLARNAGSREDYDKADAQLKKTIAQVDADRANLQQAGTDYQINIESAAPTSPRPKPPFPTRGSTWATAGCTPPSRAGSASSRSRSATSSATAAVPASW